MRYLYDTKGRASGIYILFVVAFFSTLSCSFILDYEECKVDDDCSGAKMKCTDNYCIKKTFKDLLTKECTEIYGINPTDALADNTILLGSIMPLSGALGDYGPRISAGVKLAVDEINEAGGLLSRKQLGILICDSATDGVVATKVMQHLIGMAEVPAIIGPAGSDETMTAFDGAVKYTEQEGEDFKYKDVVVISPSATSPLITSRIDNDRLWRTAPSDAAQGAALANILLQDTSLQKIAVVNRGDPYGNGLTETISGILCKAFPCLVEDGRYLSRSYELETKTNDQTDIVFALRDFAPDIVVLCDYIDDAAPLLTMSVNEGMTRFLLTDGMKSDELFNLGLPDEVLCQILGSQPASPAGDTYQGFALRFSTKFGQADGPYSANAYDALYLVAYAIAATGVENITGTNIIKGLRRLSTGQIVEAGSSKFTTTALALSASATATINYEGASGPLDFDANGEAAADIRGWVLDVDNKTVRSLEDVIYTYNGQYKPLADLTPGIGVACGSNDTDSETEIDTDTDTNTDADSGVGTI